MENLDAVLVASYQTPDGRVLEVWADGDGGGRVLRDGAMIFYTHGAYRALKFLYELVPASGQVVEAKVAG